MLIIILLLYSNSLAKIALYLLNPKFFDDADSVIQCNKITNTLKELLFRRVKMYMKFSNYRQNFLRGYLAYRAFSCANAVIRKRVAPQIKILVV
jgi:hypothetical protein